ncbi:DUF2865 domain-containing protein [Terrihabitans rhizophilus]|uniref:DUF2865 domain-containing protein n=1 Tax=Terrihabitans rhizophilus TaxID=3092662 RepID=A0ABU4RQN5_9HYPH|nr:DUF2865 domain-containing protein [Terrihabitans sp. PJ23]MDX6806409.1 DUF2865 domain-containing protein [Terrihabitans sp. PJ23]
MGQRTQKLVIATLLVAASAMAMPAVSRAESPLDFFFNQHRRANAAQEAPPQAAPPPRRGFFEGFFEAPRVQRAPRISRPAQPRPAPVETASYRGDLERVVCRRVCDGKEIALGILPESKNHGDQEAMCQAAGHGLATELVVQDFTPGAGFTPLVASAPVKEGRAAASDTAVSAEAADQCASASAASDFMVPLLNDATLRRGDIVATADGFKTFVGRGSPPFKDSDFVDPEDKRLPKEVRSLQIATR